MSSDSFVSRVPTKLDSAERVYQPPSRLLPVGGGVSPVRVCASAFTLRSSTAAHSSPATPHPLDRTSSTSTPTPASHMTVDWVAMRRMRTAPENPTPRVSVRSGTVLTQRSASLGQSPTCRQPALETPPSSLRGVAAVVALRLEDAWSDDSALLAAPAAEGEEDSCASLSCNANSASSSCGNSKSLTRTETAAALTPLQHRSSTATSPARAPSLLPPLPSSVPPPRAPSALRVPTPQMRSLTLSPSKAAERLAELPRLPLTLSPVSTADGVGTPLLPPSAVPASSSGSPTPPETESLLSEQMSSSEAALVARPGKRVGRGFTRRRKDREAGEAVGAHGSAQEHMVALCETSSWTSLLGTAASSGIERSRRTSISFNQRVSVADENDEGQTELHCLCEAPHHQSVAQPQPLSLIDADFSTLSTSTLYKRNGVLHMI